MTVRGIVLRVFAMVLATAVIGGCEPKKAPPPPGSVAVDPTMIGPNAVADAFARALRDQKTDDLKLLSGGLAPELWDVIAANIEATTQVVELLRAAYPDESPRRVDNMLRKAKEPLTMYGDVKLDGVLSGSPAEGRVVYQLAYVNLQGRRSFDEMVVVKTGDRWKVMEYGIATPTVPLLAGYRTIISKFRLTVKEFLVQFKKAKPRTLDLAFQLLQACEPKLEIDKSGAGTQSQGSPR